MQTFFDEGQRADTTLVVADRILRSCVHCGFCNATCPTYGLTGDELDGPRGRIYLIKNLLETDATPSAPVVQHLDRCLGCESCMTTCPSSVDYRSLLGIARERIEERYQRPRGEALLRWVLPQLMIRPRLFRVAMQLGKLARPFSAVMPPMLRRMLDFLPHTLSRRSAPPSPASGRGAGGEGTAHGRVVVMEGCVQQVMGTATRAATLRLLGRMGYDVVSSTQPGCCGALPLHLGDHRTARALARQRIADWHRLLQDGVGAIVVTASGCGTTLKDYEALFADEPAFAGKARLVASKTLDISEFLATRELPSQIPHPRLRVAWHSPCSLQHGQRIRLQPVALLERCGFDVLHPRDEHLCCGSAGVYNLLQPGFAARLGQDKADALTALMPDVIASANLGCQIQIGRYQDRPVMHLVELLDYACGGPPPMQPGGVS